MNQWILRGIMAEKGITQREIAMELGMSKNTLCSRLAGKSSFSAAEIEKICTFLCIKDTREVTQIFLPQLYQKGETN